MYVALMYAATEGFSFSEDMVAVACQAGETPVTGADGTTSCKALAQRMQPRHLL
mgnify:CR=1 FL=1